MADQNNEKTKSPDVGPTASQAEGDRKTVDDALKDKASSPPIAGTNDGSSVKGAKKGKKSQAA